MDTRKIARRPSVWLSLWLLIITMALPMGCTTTYPEARSAPFSGFMPLCIIWCVQTVGVETLEAENTEGDLTEGGLSQSASADLDNSDG